MSVVTPPLYWQTGVAYNPAFWSSASNTINLTQAKSLFLQKTASDTATVLETFSGGIKTATIDSAAVLNLGGTTATSVSIGKAGVPTSIVGDASVAGSVFTTNIDAVSVADGTIYIGKQQTTGAIYIGSNTSRSGNIYLANAATTVGSVAIGTAGKTLVTINGSLLTVNAPIQAATLDTAASGTLALAASATTVTLGAAGTTTNVTGTLSVGTLTVTGSETDSGTLTTTGLLTANGGLKIGGSNNITLGNGTIAPSDSGQLGFMISGTPAGSLVVTGGSTVATASVILTSAGTWYIQATAIFPSVAAYDSTSISGSSAVSNATCQSQTQSSGISNTYHSISCMMRIATNQTIYLLNLTNVTQTIQGVFLQATRIA